MKAINYFKIFLLLVLSISLVACGGDDHKNVESIAIPVEIQIAERTAYTEQLVYSGILRPIKEMKLMSDIPGKVFKLYVDEGARLKRDNYWPRWIQKPFGCVWLRPKPD